MSTATLTQPTFARSLRGVVVGSILLLAAMAVVVVLTVGRVAGTSGTSTVGHAQDTSGCRPAIAAHYC
ncbi:MAG TPA: hypothetical protein VE441_08805 [Mycobacterium sp.]|jgi:hypothetical protein|nr:hypothetical protein [Mycobacterium sp.]